MATVSESISASAHLRRPARPFSQYVCGPVPVLNGPEYYDSDSDESDGSCCEYVPAATDVIVNDAQPPEITVEEIFDDLATRFIINLPEEDLCSLVSSLVLLGRRGDCVL